MESTWKDVFKTGITIIDNQHRNLFERIDHLILAIYKGQSESELEALLEYLESYVIKHFEIEEKMMLDNEYPDYIRHVYEHKGFREIFKNIVNEFIKKGPDNFMAIRVEKEVRKWWENHVMKIDMEYVPYIKK